MNRQRYLEVEYGKDVTLTEEEQNQGWHFCADWDYMLIGPGMHELYCCTCPHDNVIKARQEILPAVEAHFDSNDKNG